MSSVIKGVTRFLNSLMKFVSCVVITDDSELLGVGLGNGVVSVLVLICVDVASVDTVNG